MKLFLSPVLLLTALLALVGVVLGAGDALAQATVNDAARNVAKNTFMVPRFIAYICYVMGVASAFKALLVLRGFIEDSDKNPLPVFLGYAAVGALLIMLPYTIGVVYATLKPGNDKITSTACAFTDKSCSPTGAGASNNKGISGVQQNITRNTSAIPKLVAFFAYIAGVFFAASGLLKLREWMIDDRQSDVTPVIMRFVVAAFLILLPSVLVMAVGTIFTSGGAAQTAVTGKVPRSTLKVY